MASRMVEPLPVPLRLSVEEMAIGDGTVHVEDAYAVWGEGETFDQSTHGNQYYPTDV
jgi:ammonium transporter, Amt family